MPPKTELTQEEQDTALAQAEEQKKIERGDYLLDDDGNPIKDDDGQPKPAAKKGDDADPDPDADPDAEADADNANKPVHRQRFNRLNEKYAKTAESEAALKAENARLAAELEAAKKPAATAAPAAAAPPPIDIKALRAQSKKLFFEGDVDKSLEIDEQIETELERRADAKAEERSKKAREEAVADIRAEQEVATWTESLTAAETKYPILSNKSETFNKEAVEAVIGWTNMHIVSGLSRSAALAKALDTVMPMYVGEAKGGGNETAEERRMKALQKASAASRAQPPALNAGQGARTQQTTAKDVRDMSDEEFRALPESEKARLRGDVPETTA